MSSKPRLEAALGAWRLERWDYDNAPLMATRDDGVVVEADKDGVMVEGLDLGSDSLFVPHDVLRALLDDARKRQVLSEPSRETGT